jgi:hypothetical protein
MRRCRSGGPAGEVKMSHPLRSEALLRASFTGESYRTALKSCVSEPPPSQLAAEGCVWAGLRSVQVSRVVGLDNRLRIELADRSFLRADKADLVAETLSAVLAVSGVRVIAVEAGNLQLVHLFHDQARVELRHRSIDPAAFDRRDRAFGPHTLTEDEEDWRPSNDFGHIVLAKIFRHSHLLQGSDPKGFVDGWLVAGAVNFDLQRQGHAGVRVDFRGGRLTEALPHFARLIGAKPTNSEPTNMVWVPVGDTDVLVYVTSPFASRTSARGSAVG